VIRSSLKSMALRCFLFSSDEKTAALVRQILEGLGVEADSCSDAVVAAEKITNQAFQIVVIDWDKQPEAGVMLNTARERKAAERPITLAIVSDDKHVPGVLQAGANSILRKPVVLNQATDTLKMARDLIRAKQESAAGGHAAAAAATAASVRSALPSSPEQNQRTLRAGEFLQSAPVSPSGQFETEADG
jgi:DNA-binding response OmpR family regulator